MRKQIGTGLVLFLMLGVSVCLWTQIPGQAAAPQENLSPLAVKAGVGLTSATVISGSVFDSAFKAPVGDQRADVPARVISGGNAEFGVYTLTEIPRPAAAQNGPIRGQFHSVVGEIYHVVSGAGTFLVGSQIDQSTITTRVSDLSGPGGNGVIKDPQFIKFTAGTVLIIPPGVPHNATYEITEKTNFIVYRFDPGKSLPLK